jgi:Fe-coproporphyrin III synthase
VVVYTNGTQALHTAADTLFVSLDGPRHAHDALRGPSFDRIVANIRESSHRSLFVNSVVNTLNKDELAGFCTFLDGLPNVRGVFFYLHTPYYGHDALELDPAERQRVLLELLALRKRHRILNSAAGLRSALRNDWARPLPSCSVYEKGAVYECCRYAGDPTLCAECGYLSYAEIDQALKLRPSALVNALRYF